ncbi:MAG: hypothetical protein QOJ68_979, partial [Blastococcus sp.]|nr:hypothetical protein [Blastococcus sp.]
MRTLVVRQFLGGRGVPPGIHDSALDRLSRRERAAIVLRLTEHLTIAETAAIVDRPAQSVAGDLAQAALAVGLDTDGIPVTPYGQETLRALERLAQQPPDPFAAQRLLADAARLRTRRRQRGATLLAALAAVVAVVALIPLVVLPRLPVKIRQPGEWVMMHRVKPPSGWTIVGRSLAPSS